MLNRLYIVIGIVAILILAAAFIVPSLIPWSSYRGRMESLAAQALGAEVRINGDIRFSLLPAPHLELTDVAVGPLQAPVMSVKSADADFSLMDFLRDRYTITRLVLDHPALDLKINKDGSVDSGLRPTIGDSRTSLSVANARIDVGTLRLVDVRSERRYSFEGVEGDLVIGALNGPIGFSGGGSLGDQHYGVKLTASALDTAGNTQVTLLAQPDGNRMSLSLDGPLSTAGVPHFTGNFTYRQSPAAGKDASGVVGDMTLTSKVDATPDKFVLSAYTLIPDENRAVTRLTGTATVDLGAEPSFSATVSSNVLALPPRDATTEQGPQPYELVRMLGELPVLPVPPLPGTIAADVSELNLRSFSLHDVKLLATTDAKQWSVKDFSGALPGNTLLKLSGDIGDPDGRPSFAGAMSIASGRLDTLATLWRKPAPGNPLFNMPGAFQSKVSVLGQTVALTDGQLTLDGAPQSITALIKFGDDRRIDLSGQFTDLSAAASEALVALLPDLQQDASAGLTFPQGAVSLAADSANLFGLDGKQLALEGKWANGTIELSKFSAADLGGAGLDLSLALSGSLAAPHIAGDGDITLKAGGGPALDWLFDAWQTPKPVRDLLALSLPAQLKAHLDDPKDDGSQGLSLSGKAGVADVTLVAQLDGGVLRALASPVQATFDLEAADARALTGQLGLGDVSLLPETGPVKLAASVAGTPAGSLKTTLDVTGGGDSIGFDGTLTPGDLTAISGAGKLKVALSDTSVILGDAGLSGIAAPPVKGEADIRFDTTKSLTLDNLAGSSGPTGFSGSLAVNGSDKGAAVTGALTLDTADLSALVAAIGGPTSLMTSAGKLWPDGPIAVGDAPRKTTGNVSVETPSVTLDRMPLLRDAGFAFGWDATGMGIHKFEAKLGGGMVDADVGLCCAGTVADKQLRGEASVKGVALDALLPPATAANLSGTIDGSLRFEGGGDSIESLLNGLSGEGSFHATGLAVQRFDPSVFAAVAATPDIVNLDSKDLTSRVATGLDQGPLALPQLDGTIAIAGGVLRIPNLGADPPGGKLFGGATVKLADLSLGGSFALSPVGKLDAAGVVSETTSKVTANLGGTLLAPSRTLDIASMVDAIKVKALEVEVARLEALKAADDARAQAQQIARAKAKASETKEAAEDKAAAKLVADQQAAAIAAAEAAVKKAAADAAAKAAADLAAKKAAQAAADAAAKAAAQKTVPQPFDLQMPGPGAFQ